MNPECCVIQKANNISKSICKVTSMKYVMEFTYELEKKYI